MKRVTAVYFSPTGGSKKYAEAIAATLDENYQSIDLTKRENRKAEYTFGPEDLVVLAAPVYAGRLPLLPENLYSNLKGREAKAIVAVTYGNREFDDALLEGCDICRDNGFSVIGAAAFLAQHTYSDKLAGGRPDEADLQEAAAFAKQIAEAEEALDLSVVPGNRPYKEGKRLPMHTETGERCSECGLCAKKCPVGAIAMSAGMEADGEKCIGCLSCVKGCPRGARLVSDPGLAAIREKLEPAFGGIHKEHSFFPEIK